MCLIVQKYGNKYLDYIHLGIRTGRYNFSTRFVKSFTYHLMNHVPRYISNFETAHPLFVSHNKKQILFLNFLFLN